MQLRQSESSSTVNVVLAWHGEASVADIDPRHVSIDWGEIYHSCYPELVRFLHRKVWDEERAHDLAQEVFARALSQEPDNPRAWIFKVATNLARDEARMVVRRKRHLTLLRGDAEVATRPAPSPAEEFEEKQRQERVREALEALGDRDREVLLLWDAGLDYSEIAKQTGLARGAIGTTLSRARKRLVESYDALEGKNAAHR
ncbi:MAG: sigma-70 family RNA polymerase sigma factor [Gemmatimonas sp.]|nr:sigma-70 family RNA polymerase sigma factor [Gemmatimonas sp.]